MASQTYEIEFDGYLLEPRKGGVPSLTPLTLDKLNKVIKWQLSI